jgi:hypothetical protein
MTPAIPIPATTVGRESGDFAVVSAAEGESAGVPGADSAALAVREGEGVVVGGTFWDVLFAGDTVVPGAAVALDVPVVALTAATVGVPEAVTEVVGEAVTVTGAIGVVVTVTWAKFAGTGTINTKMRSRITDRAWCKDNLVVIRDNWISGDMRFMDPQRGI